MAKANPFTTRWTRPGQIAPVDAEGQLIGLARLLDRLAAVGGRGPIVASRVVTAARKACPAASSTRNTMPGLMQT